MNINLIAISYENIGPFRDKIISIFFQNWKFLIKAPVGTGKSFLFFDWPIYWLYKYSNRNVLNIKSKEGYIKLVFEINDQQYFVTRKITKAKSKESCASKLYTLSKKIEFPKEKQETITSKDIQITIKEQNIELEEIVFKNETDLQQNIQDFLPPKEVFLNTVFLTQDSDNIFELQPAERLNVLKNIFNLLGIDEAKEEIAEKRKEVWYKIKATTDTHNQDIKLQNLIKNYIKNLQNLEKNNKTDIDIPNQKEFISELEFVQDKISINDFSNEHFPKQLPEDIQIQINQQNSEYEKIKTESANVKNQIIQEENNIKTIEKLINEIKDNNSILEKKINNINPNNLLKLKEEKTKKRTTQSEYEKEIPTQLIQKFNQDNWNIIEHKLNEITLSSTYNYLQNIINEGKKLNDEIQKQELKIKNEELLQKNQEEKLSYELKSKEEKLSEIKKQIIKLQEKEKTSAQQIETQASFACEKIDGQCPFIKVINKKTFDQLELQKNEISKEILEAEKNQKTIENEIKTIKKDIENFQKQEHPEIKKSKENIQITKEKIETIKNFLTQVNWKTIQDNYQNNQTIEEEIKKIDREIEILEVESSKIEQYKKELEKNITQIQMHEKTIKDNQTKIKELQTKEEEIKKNSAKYNTSSLAELEKTINEIKNIQRDIDNLIKEHKHTQIEIKQLQEEEKILNNLYLVFSKELLLIVLQDSLPILNDIVNNYLAQVVEYQINLSLNTTNSEKIELEAKIFDEKWERDIKSLSGGQRVLLKLTWMLAISSYMNSPILFLDETINNLDQDTVGKVADMLENFTKQRNMKFYTVTHSQQIQEMHIWDETIEIK